MNIVEMVDEVRNLPEGDYAECGVYQGDSAVLILAHMNSSAKLWLFDSFEGHAEPCEFDDAIHHPKGRYSDTSVEKVRERVKGAEIIKGFLPGSLAVVAALPFRFVHIDLDHYLPTKAACEFFKPRMVKGGFIRFDDYKASTCEGATKAIDEVFGRDSILPGDYRWQNS